MTPERSGNKKPFQVNPETVKPSFLDSLRTKPEAPEGSTEFQAQAIRIYTSTLGENITGIEDENDARYELDKKSLREKLKEIYPPTNPIPQRDSNTEILDRVNSHTSRRKRW